MRLSGVIGSGTRRNLNLANLAGALERAFSMPRAPAVALQVNSPGGSPVQSALIASRIRELAEERQRPVIAFVEDVAASGGYWLACAADEIHADPSSIVGSIGVIAATFGLHDFIGRYGVERRVYTAGERKLMLDPFQPEKADDVERLKVLQADIHEAFKAHVTARRGDRLKQSAETLFTGDVWTGQRAIDLGLIDGLGHLRSVLRDRFGPKVRPRLVNRERSWLQRRFGFDMRAAGSLASADGGVPDLATALVDEALGALDERLLRARLGL